MNHPFSITERLGRYELSKPIGRGGMAEVFEGYSIGDGGFRRRVAIKRLLPTGGAVDPAGLRAFLDEARICSVLHHRNIVSILDFGIIDGCPFQVMEYVDGLNALDAMNRLVRAGDRISEAVALYICRSVALALAHAHEAADAGGPLGIVHRDVKPGNILLSWDGEVKLADFGIALGRERTERTEAGLVKGTPSYMAPEQLAGLAVDGRADLFALGCVLHALLAGKSPMSSVSALDLLRGSEVSLDPSIAPDIASVIRTCVEAYPEVRVASARAMVDLLDGLIGARTKQDAPDLEALLRPLREPTTPRRGKLDGLLDVALIPTASPAPGTDHEPPLRARSEAETRLASRKDEKDEDDGTAGEPTRVAAPAGLERGRRGAPWAVAIGLLAVVVALAWVASRSLFHGHAATAASLTPESVEPAPSPLVEAPPEKVPPASPSVESASLPQNVPSAPSASVRPASPVQHVRQPVRAPPQVVRPASETGFVAFRAADGATRTTIVVDGAARGFAPRILELPLGPHAISFIDASGSPFGAASLEVRPEHSRESPKAIDVMAAPGSR